MSSNLDKSLDEIISAKKKQNPRPRRSSGARQSSTSRGKGAKAAAVGGAAVAAQAISQANRQQPPVVFPPKGGKGQGSKVIVSNLPTDVTEAQVKELFSTTIGPLRRVLMSYRANGQSTGVVTVEFQRADDANRAYAQYNNRLIDGKRPLKIEVVVDPARAAVAAPPVGQNTAAKPAPAGKAKKSSRNKKRREARPAKTLEDLDAEMEDYSKQANTAEAQPMQDAPAA
ncbi:Similar to S.cerevisiae protein YRA1 (Nuclear polyadenylated RNA-binding protein) [Malassezia sympodialis ATCC 42132]|uniref:Similar to S.cerevisiae protein YRA1 (Nuclear polyadenylated RNA-binding protein) n=1 Tax=Malassezia sympodialis (strain ATCC 42132) TaxID=1230383 RepID=A0A1M8A4I9_MALS4|nr:Similar to S.cerevisiae protein YRA1 (Nuclear polyadenylated RNA-binding protein) [Malassezia sympodialis ATCC 42132]